MLVTQEKAQALAARAFLRCGVRDGMAADAARMMTMAEMMGITTHGLARVSNYVDRLQAGGMDPRTEPVITAPAPALLQVDGRNGLGPAVALRATRAAMNAARATGIAAAFCRHSTHLGALAPLLWIAAQDGFAAIITTNTAPMIAPAGGRRALLGNAPVGLAIPDEDGMPVLLDMALSVAARSKVRAAASAGASIPETWATDAQGRPTTDAAAAMDGLMQAIGGAKGAHLALCLDLFAGGLSGAAMMGEIPNANTTPDVPPDLGHMIVIIDAARLMPPDRLSARLADARNMVETTPRVDPAQAIRLPGARAVAALKTAQAQGFTLAPDLFDTLSRLAGD